MKESVSGIAWGRNQRSTGMMTREVFSLVKVSVENDEIRIAQRIAGHQYLSQRT
jgi:hypothetical protein